jgi:hypothetical protein
MFSNLTDLKRKRTAKEAVGFYIAFLILLLVLVLALSYLDALVTGEKNSNVFYNYGNAFAIIACLILSFLIIIKKKQTGNFFYLLLTIVSGVLAAFGGIIIGLIPVAYLTTR